MRKVINYTMKDCTDEVLSIIKNAGVDGLDLFPDLMDEEQCMAFPKVAENFRKKLEKHGLECCQVHLPAPQYVFIL